MSNYAPYTYLIGWNTLGKYYYGVRYAKNCNPSDFWKRYFTSSKKVKEYVNQYGKPDVIEIRKTFSSAAAAIKWETTVLRRLNVLVEDKWLNANIAGAQLQTPETRKKKSEKLKGRKKPEGFGAIVSKNKKNTKLSEETKRLLSTQNQGARHPQYGTTASEQKKRKISLKNKGKTPVEMTCPHCATVGRGSVMFRHHFDRCRGRG
jgi:hypothetical protein